MLKFITRKGKNREFLMVIFKGYSQTSHVNINILVYMYIINIYIFFRNCGKSNILKRRGNY